MSSQIHLLRKSADNHDAQQLHVKRKAVLGKFLNVTYTGPMSGEVIIV